MTAFATMRSATRGSTSKRGCLETRDALVANTWECSFSKGLLSKCCIGGTVCRNRKHLILVYAQASSLTQASGQKDQDIRHILKDISTVSSNQHFFQQHPDIACHGTNTIFTQVGQRMYKKGIWDVPHIGDTPVKEQSQYNIYHHKFHVQTPFSRTSHRYSGILFSKLISLIFAIHLWPTCFLTFSSPTFLVARCTGSGGAAKSFNLTKVSSATRPRSGTLRFHDICMFALRIQNAPEIHIYINMYIITTQYNIL